MDLMAPGSEQPEANDLLRNVRRFKFRILAVTAVAVAAAATFSWVQAPVYEASAEVVVRQSGSPSLFSGLSSQPTDPERLLGTEIRVVRGPEVRAAVQSRLGGAPPKVAVQAATDADVIRITARGGHAHRSSTVANAYADSYLEFRQREAMEAFVKVNRDLQAAINDFQGQIEKATGTERDTLLQAQGGFRQKLAEAQVGGTLGTGGARVIQPATDPTSPVSPTPVRTSVLALFSGLILGVGVALLSGYLDESVRSKEDLERAAPGLVTVGLLPLAADAKGGPSRVLTLHDPRSATAEAFRALRTSVQFLHPEEPARMIQITSPSPGDGKTTVVANLAVAMALAGQRVAVVCCDLRRPNLHKLFGLTNDVGLSSVIIGHSTLSASLQAVDGMPSLVVLSAGPPPPNPAELLGSKRAAQVLDSLLAVVDVVVIDCPPVLPVTDALVVSSRVDATLLVCRAKATSRKRIARAVELLHQVEAPLLGTILNGVAVQDSDIGPYQYYGRADHVARGAGDAP